MIASELFIRSSALKVYRHLMMHLQIIPDIEIRALTSETMATAILASGSTSGSISLGSKSPERLLSKLMKEARAIEAATGGAQKIYARMMEKTYARRGKRRWELLDALFPVSLQRSQLKAVENSPLLSRRSRSPPPYPDHIAPLVPKKKGMETPARAVLKSPTIRFLANRAWEERAFQLARLDVPLALRIRQDATAVSTTGTDGLRDPLQPLDDQDVTILSRDMSEGERKRLVVWLKKADTMLRQIEEMKTLRETVLRPPIHSLSKDPGSLFLTSEPNVNLPSRPQPQLPLRTLRRMYSRLSDTSPSLIGVRSGSSISWQQSVIKRRTGKTGCMLPDEAEWIV